MKPKKKNKVFAFLCSFMPGAAEMYMGYMKMGISLMGVFFACCLIPTILLAADYFYLVGIVIWFYGFFHARNLDATDDAEFAEIRDQFIWEEFTDGKPVRISQKSVNKWIGIVVLLIGCAMLWNSVDNLIYDMIPDDLWETLYPIASNIPGFIFSVIIIVLGVRLIIGKKKTFTEAEGGSEYGEEK